MNQIILAIIYPISFFCQQNDIGISTWIGLIDSIIFGILCGQLIYFTCNYVEIRNLVKASEIFYTIIGINLFMLLLNIILAISFMFHIFVTYITSFIIVFLLLYVVLGLGELYFGDKRTCNKLLDIGQMINYNYALITFFRMCVLIGIGTCLALIHALVFLRKTLM